MSSNHSHTLRNRSDIDYSEYSDNDEDVPCIEYEPMSKSERKALPKDMEEIHKVLFPEFHSEDKKLWVPVVTTECKYYLRLRDAVEKFGGDKRKNIISYAEFLNGYYKSALMTDLLWNSIQDELLATVKHDIPRNSLCFVKNENLILKYRYVKILHQSSKKKKIIFNQVSQAQIYYVQNVDPESTSCTTFPEGYLKHPKGYLARDQLLLLSKPIKIANSVNDNDPDMDWEWILLQNHYLKLKQKQIKDTISNEATKEFAKKEFIQIMYCLGNKINSNMTMPKFRQSASLYHSERMSYSTKREYGHDILTKISANVNCKQRYLHYTDINYKKLASIMGLDLLTKEIDGNIFSICHINMKYNKDNIMLGIEYWLMYVDPNGKSHTKYLAASN